MATKLEFDYELVNAEHLGQHHIDQIQDALGKRAYVCQQEFEKMLDKYHQINVLADADDEAFVSKIEIENGVASVELDCSKVQFDSEHCINCGAEITAEDIAAGQYFEADGGGLICKQCIIDAEGETDEF